MLERLTTWARWLWSPIAALWREVIGLRTEEIRSLAVVAGLVMMFRGFDRIEAADVLTAPFVVLTIICLVMTAGLAWQATHIKGQWGAVMLSLGRDPDPDDRVTVSPTNPAAMQPDDPDAGEMP